MIKKLFKLGWLIGCFVILFLKKVIIIIFFKKRKINFSPKGKKIIFFDTKVPSNSSAGELSFIELYNYLESIASLRFIVKAPLSSTFKSDKIKNLEQITLRDAWRLRKLIVDSDYIVIMSPESTLFFNFISVFLWVINTDIVYYSTDIFSDRYRSEYEVTNSLSSLFYSYYYKFCEPLIWSSSAWCFSNRKDEAGIISTYNQSVSLVPTRVLYDFKIADLTMFEDKSKGEINLLFVGGVGNAPNISAVKFIFDELIYQLNLKFHNKWVLNLVGFGWEKYLFDNNFSSDNVKIFGVVSDERLQELYTQSFFSLAPLQFGSGVKGKVIEAMYNSLIVITTPVGAEGIECQTLVPRSSAEIMVDDINVFLGDQSFWKYTIDGYHDYLEENFGEVAMNKGLNV